MEDVKELTHTTFANTAVSLIEIMVLLASRLSSVI